MRVLAVVLLAGCASHAAPRSARDPVDPPTCSPVTVRVVDETGAPLAGVDVHSRASFWVGPEGGFYYEGGGVAERTTAHVETDADGLAQVCDAGVAAETDRARINAIPQPSVWYGGMGAPRAGRVREVEIIAARDGWPRAYATMTPLLGAGRVELVLGPPRSVELDVRSQCEPDGVTVAAGASRTLDPPQVTRASGSRWRLSGLGPYEYKVSVACCGTERMHTIDARTATTGNVVVLDDGALPRPRYSTPIASVAVGRESSCAVAVDGAVYCWGSDAMGLLGASLPQPRPVRVPQLDLVEDIGFGSQHACALRRDGSVWCWGDNSVGQLGGATTDGRTQVPLEVPGLRARALSVGSRHTCALTMERTVACWGWNDYGQLGLGDRVDRTEPTQIAGLADVEEVRGGMFHSCARVRSGAILCWGSDSHGQIGDSGQGIGAYRSSPVRVSGASNASHLELGLRHSCATIGRELVCWGGTYGAGPSRQLHRPATVSVPGETATVIASAVGDSHSCAVLADHSVMCWGSDTSGQLGDGVCTRSYEPARKPVRVLGL